jgi:hypothetical protein
MKHIRTDEGSIKFLYLKYRIGPFKILLFQTQKGMIERVILLGLSRTILS